MFDKLEDMLIHLEEILNMLNEPDVINDPPRFQKLMKEQSELTPVAEAYREYKKCKETIEDSLSMLEGESDEEMREMFKGRTLPGQKAQRRAGAGTEGAAASQRSQ